MRFRLKDNKKFRLKLGSSVLVSNELMTKKLAIDFLRINKESRKKLFDILPENIDELLTPKSKTKPKE